MKLFLLRNFAFLFQFSKNSLLSTEVRLQEFRYDLKLLLALNRALVKSALHYRTKKFLETITQKVNKTGKSCQIIGV